MTVKAAEMPADLTRLLEGQFTSILLLIKTKDWNLYFDGPRVRRLEYQDYNGGLIRR